METVKGIKNQFNNKNNNDEIHSFILRLNVSKYRKLIIHILQTLFPRILSLMLPCRVSSFSSLIRVVLDTYDDVNVALTSCSRSLYASPPLRSRGLLPLVLYMKLPQPQPYPAYCMQLLPYEGSLLPRTCRDVLTAIS